MPQVTLISKYFPSCLWNWGTKSGGTPFPRRWKMPQQTRKIFVRPSECVRRLQIGVIYNFRPLSSIHINRLSKCDMCTCPIGRWHCLCRRCAKELGSSGIILLLKCFWTLFIVKYGILKVTAIKIFHLQVKRKQSNLQDPSSPTSKPSRCIFVTYILIARILCFF